MNPAMTLAGVCAVLLLAGVVYADEISYVLRKLLDLLRGYDD